MKTSSKELMIIWDDLQDIFLDFKGVNGKVRKELQRIGFEVYGDKHPKIRVKGQVVTLSTSPSDKYAGRQILRIIRRIYERN